MLLLNAPKFAMKHDAGFAVSVMRFVSSFKVAEPVSTAIVGNGRCPFGFNLVPTNALKAGFAVRPWFGILHVLPVRGLSQVISAIVEAVAVFVVNNISRHGTGYQSMHKCSGSFPQKPPRTGCINGVWGRQGLPASPLYKMNVASIDSSLFASSEGHIGNVAFNPDRAYFGGHRQSPSAVGAGLRVQPPGPVFMSQTALFCKQPQRTQP